MKSSDIQVGEIYAIASAYGWRNKLIPHYIERARVIETGVEYHGWNSLGARTTSKRVRIQVLDRNGTSETDEGGIQRLVPASHVQALWSEFLVLLGQEQKAKAEADRERDLHIAKEREERNRLIADIEGWMDLNINSSETQSAFPALSRLDDAGSRFGPRSEVNVPVSELHRIIKRAFEQGKAK